MPDPIDGSRQELDRGVVITMPPAKGIHGIVCSKVGRLIGNYSDTRGLGQAASNNTGVVVKRAPDIVRGPDVAFWSFERQPTIPEGYFEVAPELVVEVVSPSNTQSKIWRKNKEYFFHGTRRVWVVYPEDRMVAVFTSPSDSKLLEETDTLEGGDALPGFRCQVADFFPAESSPQPSRTE